MLRAYYRVQFVLVCGVFVTTLCCNTYRKGVTVSSIRTGYVYTWCIHKQ